MYDSKYPTLGVYEKGYVIDYKCDRPCLYRRVGEKVMVGGFCKHFYDENNNRKIQVYLWDEPKKAIITGATYMFSGKYVSDSWYEEEGVMNLSYLSKPKGVFVYCFRFDIRGKEFKTTPELITGI